MIDPRIMLLNALAQIGRLDLFQVRFIPEGARDPLPGVPPMIEISDHDIDDALEHWDKTMPEYAGMLDADVIRRQNASDT